MTLISSKFQPCSEVGGKGRLPPPARWQRPLAGLAKAADWREKPLVGAANTADLRQLPHPSKMELCPFKLYTKSL